MNRRQALAALGGAGLLLAVGGVYLRRQGSAAGPPPLGPAGWLHIGPGGTVRLYSFLTEMGQGIATVLAQLVAGELDCPIESISVEAAPLPGGFRDGWSYWTGGSASVTRIYRPLRETAAKARTLMLRAAAEQWNVPQAGCVTESGVVVHAATGRRLDYGQLAAGAARLRVPSRVTLRDPAASPFLGRSQTRIGSGTRVDGSMRYAADRRVSGMPCALIVDPSRLGATVGNVDESTVNGLRGLKRIVSLGHCIAIVGDDHAVCLEAAGRLRVDWQGGHDGFSSRQLRDQLASAIAGDAARSVSGSHERINTLWQAAHRRIEVKVELPFLAQLPLEMLGATVTQIDARSVSLELATQAQDRVAAAVAAELGIALQDVEVRSIEPGGGFGRRLATDTAVDAVRLARAIGSPVRVFFTRHADFARGHFRPAAAIHARAVLASDGGLAAVATHLATTQPGAPVAGLEGLPYRAGQIAVGVTNIAIPVATGAWRSIEYSCNIHAIESLIDQCAITLARDPIELRTAWLNSDVRGQRVLGQLREMQSGLREDETAGVAFASLYGSRIAMAVSIGRTSATSFELRGVDVVVDCGFAVNPRGVEDQIIGATVFGLEAALFGEVRYLGGRVMAQNFDGYRLLRMHEVPHVAVALISDPAQEPGGVGELAVPVVAPALCSAIARQFGIRPQRLPIAGEHLQLASAPARITG
ncbi:MAG: molybdopterin cofactor-binding domain-containing protein [Steroidobacteraceae bacterium]